MKALTLKLVRSAAAPRKADKPSIRERREYALRAKAKSWLSLLGGTLLVPAFAWGLLTGASPYLYVGLLLGFKLCVLSVLTCEVDFGNYMRRFGSSKRAWGSYARAGTCGAAAMLIPASGMGAAVGWALLTLFVLCVILDIGLNSWADLEEG